MDKKKKKTVKLTLDLMAYGGSAISKGGKKRSPVFVPFGIPKEQVRVELGERDGSMQQGRLVGVVKASAERVSPKCTHFTHCGGCHFQHIRYPAQLRTKTQVLREQLSRARLDKGVKIRPIIANPQPWASRIETTLNPIKDDGGMGYWSPSDRQVIPVQECPVLAPALQQLMQDVDLALPDLQKLTLRLGVDESPLMVLETQEAEPPYLAADFPVSVALVMPDGVAATLIGDLGLPQVVKERPFSVSAGVFFYPTLGMADKMVDAVLGLAKLSGTETMIEVGCGAGVLSAFLSAETETYLAIDKSDDAINDAAVNLDHTKNVSLYQGWAEDILSGLPKADVLMMDVGKKGGSAELLSAIHANQPDKLIVVSHTLSTFIRDARQLTKLGRRLLEIQPIDLIPHHFEIQTISLWR